MPTTSPVPSTDPSDLLFNAGKLDEVVNGAANSFTDRMGVARRTVAGMNADFDAQLADAESDLNVYRADAAASAAEALGYLQTIRATSYGAYASDPATDPLGNPPTVGDEYFNTTANLLKRWNGTTWQASDINTANLAAPSGSSLVGYLPAGTGAVATTAQEKQREKISIFDFMTAEQIADIQSASPSINITTQINKAVAFVSGKRGKLTCPPGRYLYTPPLSIPYNMILEGEGAASDLISESSVSFIKASPGIGLKLLDEEITVKNILFTAAENIRSIDTGDGIQIGEAFGANAGRTRLEGVYSCDHGGDGIRLKKGNLCHMDIVTYRNKGHGLNLTIDAGDIQDNNANWIKLETMGNLKDGLHIGRSESNFITVVTQGNYGWGVYINWPRNIIGLYSEGNILGGVKFDGSASKNYLYGTINEGKPTYVNHANRVQYWGLYESSLYEKYSAPGSEIRRYSYLADVYIPSIAGNTVYEEVINYASYADTSNVNLTVVPEQGVRWSASTAFTSTTYVRPTTPNGYRYQIQSTTGDGKTGSTDPVWPTTLNATVVDGNVTWKNIGSAALPGSLIWSAYASGQDQITVRFYNTSATATPVQGDLRSWRIGITVVDDSA